MVHREVISAKTAIKARSPERKCGKTKSRTDIIPFRGCKQRKWPMPAHVWRVDIMYAKGFVAAWVPTSLLQMVKLDSDL